MPLLVNEKSAREGTILVLLSECQSLLHQLDVQLWLDLDLHDLEAEAFLRAQHT